MSALDFIKIAASPASNAEAEPAPDVTSGARITSRLERARVVDAATRLIARRGDHRVPWAAIAIEAGGEPFGIAPEWIEDLPALIDECYARTAQALADSLL